MKSPSLNNITVSVIMLTYGHERYIKQAVEGVLLQQSNFNIELIIANDCSPDATNNIVQGIIDLNPKGNLIKYINRVKNIGAQSNFIDAYKQCSGKYIALCEGDDYWVDAFKLQKQVDFLEANQDYVLCFHKVNILKINGDIVNDFITKIPENYQTIETLSRLGNYIHTPSVVFKNVIEKLPFEFEKSPLGDYFLYMLLAKYGKLKYLKDTMAIYRYGVGIHSSTSSIKIIKNNIHVFGLLFSSFSNHSIKDIFLDRKIKSINNLEETVRLDYKNHFTSKSFIVLNKKKLYYFYKKIKSLFNK